MPFQHGVGLNQQDCFAQRTMKPVRMRFQACGEDDEHQPFGTGKTWFCLRFALKQAELLPQEHNLQIFLIRRNSAGDSHIDDQREKAQQQVIEHRLRNNPRFRKDQFPAYHVFALNLVAESAHELRPMRFFHLTALP